MKKNNKEAFYTSTTFISLVLIFISLLSSSNLVSMKLIPNKYLIVVITGLMIIDSLLILGMRFKKAKSSLKILSLVFCLIVSLITLQINKGTQFMSRITGANKDVYNLVFIVKDDSEIKSVKDLRNEKVGANIDFDGASIDVGLPLIKSQFNYIPNLIDYSKFDKLGEDLMDGNVDVILTQEFNISIFDELIQDFKSRVRILEMVSYEQSLDIENTDVNVTEDAYSIFVTGIDTYGSISSVSRSDVNMLITVSPKTHEVLLTSIPRDYYVELGTKGKKDKLTHAGIYGVNESIQTIEKLLNVDIDYFLKVNFSSVQNIVDALGGVDVYSEHAFRAYTDNSVYIQSGMNHVNGKQALAFVRERYGLPRGDHDRVMNQQELIKAVINKAVSPKMLSSFGKVLGSVSSAIQTSIPQDTLSLIIKDQLNNNHKWTIIQSAVSGNGSYSSTTYSMYGHNVYVMIPDIKSVEVARSKIKSVVKGERLSE